MTFNFTKREPAPNAKKQPSFEIIASSNNYSLNKHQTTSCLYYFILFIIYSSSSHITTSTKCAQNYLIPKQCYMYFFIVTGKFAATCLFQSMSRYNSSKFCIHLKYIKMPLFTITTSWCEIIFCCTRKVSR